MKDHLLALANGISDEGQRLNLVREYLQAHALRSLQLADGFSSIAFQGGTALRFIHGLRRFSEDLDFALERRERQYDFKFLMDRVQKDYLSAGYVVEVTSRTDTPVNRGFLNFPGLPLECGLSAPPDQKLTIRIEIDSVPPKGAILETRLVTRHFPVMFLAHDLSSCMAGKVLAVLVRGHTKGRDIYDLGWYLTSPENPKPNILLLQNGLRQTAWEGSLPDEDSWAEVLLAHLTRIDWKQAEADVLPFLEERTDSVLLGKDLIMGELEKRLK